MGKKKIILSNSSKREAPTMAALSGMGISSDFFMGAVTSGEQTYLRNNDNAAKIRALLLAGIRAAVLWQQLGGSRWTLFWSRRRYIATAKKLLSYN